MVNKILMKRILQTLVFVYFNGISTSYKLLEENKSPENFKNDIVVKHKNVFKPVYGQDDITKDIEERKLLTAWNIFNKGIRINNDIKNKILVKRIVPHGIAPSGIEIDHKFNTVYKPLVRVHKTKTQNQIYNELELNENVADFNKNMKQKNVIFISPEGAEYKIGHDSKDEDLLEPFKTSQRFDFKYKLVKEIQKRIKAIKCKSKRLKAYDKVINVLNNILRSPQFEKSGEANDPMAPGKLMLPEEYEEVKEKPKKWIPHYPPWNYWTYKKTIHEDVCPGTQVKIGNMCIWTPPH